MNNQDFEHPAAKQGKIPITGSNIDASNPDAKTMFTGTNGEAPKPKKQRKPRMDRGNTKDLHHVFGQVLWAMRELDAKGRAKVIALVDTYYQNESK